MTNPNYWDCNCDAAYIHPKTVEKCVTCGAQRDEQPDSHENEITKHLAVKGVGK